MVVKRGGGRDRKAGNAKSGGTAKAAKKAATKQAKKTATKQAKKAATKQAKKTATKQAKKRASGGSTGKVASRRSASADAVPAVEAMPLGGDRDLLKTYYAGGRIPSPNGGFLIPLGVRPAGAGGAALLLECSASSLRYRLDIPKATRTERTKVREALAEGREPDCPRHGSRLIRAGRDLTCTLCGVPYARVS